VFAIVGVPTRNKMYRTSATSDVHAVLHSENHRRSLKHESSILAISCQEAQQVGRNLSGQFPAGILLPCSKDYI